MDTKSKTPVGAYYEKHHITGNRLRQSFMEDVRKQIFSDWIGVGKSVLDLGGRDGPLTRHYLDGNRVILADIDCAALAYAKENYAVETVEVNLNERLPFDSDSYDGVVMAEVLEHLPYPRFTLSEVHRVLRRGGSLLEVFHSPIILKIAGKYSVAKSFGWPVILPIFSSSNTMNSFCYYRITFGLRVCEF